MILKFINLLSIIINLNLNISKIHSLKDTVNAYLTIPKISVSRPIYDKEDIRSNIDENIVFVETSDTPIVKNGNVIIAGHSGSETVSYFKNLYKLKNGDAIYLEYKKYKYKYIVDNIYLVNKTGKVEIRRDDTIETITLITCFGKDKQLVIIGNKANKTKK